MNYLKRMLWGFVLVLSAAAMGLAGQTSIALAAGSKLEIYPAMLDLVAGTASKTVSVTGCQSLDGFNTITVWSEDTNVVTVDKEFHLDEYARDKVEFTVKPEGAGDTQVQIRAENRFGQVLDSATIPVSVARQKAYMALSKTSLDMQEKDGRTIVNLSGTYSKEISAVVEDPNVCSAAIDYQGYVLALYITPVGDGETTVTVTAAETPVYEECSASLKVKVTGKKASTVDLGRESLEMRLNDSPFRIWPEGEGDGQIRVSSSNSNVASVYYAGASSPIEITPKGIGTAIITVDRLESTNYKPSSATLQVTVKEAAVEPGPVEPIEPIEPGKPSGDSVQIYRLLNPYNGDHLYTDSMSEYNDLVRIGWRGEGNAWKSPKSSSTPVYRLYNPYSGDHHYTINPDEYENLGRTGWEKEGIKYYSDDAHGTPIYRLFNPYVKIGTHFYTTDKVEYDNLQKIGWEGENVGWYGL